MEFGTIDILVALGMLVLVAILLDGIRRVRLARQGKLRMSRRQQPIFEDDDFDEYGSELPSGGARVVGYRDEEHAAQVRKKIEESQAKGVKVTAPFREKPDQARLDLDEPIPVLMQPVDVPDTDTAERKPAPAGERTRANLSPAGDAGDEMAAGNQVSPTDKSVPVKKTVTAEPERTPESGGVAENPGEVIVLHVMARKGAVFQGEQLLDALLKNGLRYGSMKIFHRHEREEGSGPILFSMANAVKPGTFELNNMDRFTTPGVSFFITLDDLEEPLDTFNTMMETLNAIAKELDGEMKDGNRSALTRQTVEHYRQRVIEFARRRLSVDS